MKHKFIIVSSRCVQSLCLVSVSNQCVQLVCQVGVSSRCVQLVCLVIVPSHRVQSLCLVGVSSHNQTQRLDTQTRSGVVVSSRCIQSVCLVGVSSHDQTQRLDTPTRSGKLELDNLSFSHTRGRVSKKLVENQEQVQITRSRFQKRALVKSTNSSATDQESSDYDWVEIQRRSKRSQVKRLRYKLPI